MKVSKKAQMYCLDSLEFNYLFDESSNKFRVFIYYYFGPIRVYQRTRCVNTIEKVTFIEREEVEKFKSDCYLWNEVLVYWD